MTKIIGTSRNKQRMAEIGFIPIPRKKDMTHTAPAPKSAISELKTETSSAGKRNLEIRALDPREVLRVYI